MQIKLTISSAHSVLTSGQPVQVLTLQRQAPGREATGVPIFKSLVGLDPDKSRRKRDSNPGSTPLVADALTTKPTRLSNIKDKDPLIRAAAESTTCQLKAHLARSHSCGDRRLPVYIIKDSLTPFSLSHRLFGLVVKASASTAEDPGFESRLRRDFFGVESYQ